MEAFKRVLLQYRVQEDLNRIVEWSHTWQLVPISYRKCCIFDLYHSHDDIYSIENCVLPAVHEIVDLGVSVNNSIKSSKHIAKVTLKGHIMANLILKCFLSRDINSLVRACTTYVGLLHCRLESSVKEKHWKSWKSSTKVHKAPPRLAASNLLSPTS